MLKGSLLTAVILAAVAASAGAQNDEKGAEAKPVQQQPAAESPEGVEKAQRFRSPQLEPTLLAPQSCQAPTKITADKLDLARLSQAQGSSAQLEELGAGYTWTPTYRYCCCRIWPYARCFYCRC